MTAVDSTRRVRIDSSTSWAEVVNPVEQEDSIVVPKVGSGQCVSTQSWWQKISPWQQAVIALMVFAAYLAVVFWAYDLAIENKLKHRPALIFASIPTAFAFMAGMKAVGIKDDASAT